MPIKIFAAPGDQRDDFAHVEEQANTWIEQNRPHIISVNTTVNDMPTKREAGAFMMSLVIHYEASGS